MLPSAEEGERSPPLVFSTAPGGSEKTALLEKRQSASLLLAAVLCGPRGPHLNLFSIKKVVYTNVYTTFWWKRVDSDHRSETQQIYSLPPLATRELFHFIGGPSRTRTADQPVMSR